LWIDSPWNYGLLPSTNHRYQSAAAHIGQNRAQGCADRLEKQTAKCELVGVTGWFEAVTTIATT
jgi:hypothetical protein